MRALLASCSLYFVVAIAFVTHPSNQSFKMRQLLQRLWESFVACEEDNVVDPVNISQGERSSPHISNEEEERFNTAVQVLFQYTNNVEPIDNQKRVQPPTSMSQVRQLEVWDCGIASIQMVLRWLRNNDDDTPTRGNQSPAEEAERRDLLEFVGTESIWTIDLLLLLDCWLQQESLLQQHKASYLLCSKTLEVDPSHSRLGYYQQAFSKDELRVKERFDEASTRQLPLFCCRNGLKWSRVLELVSRIDCIAILLVDNSILRPPFLTTTKTTYAGHYVVVCGMTVDPDDCGKGSDENCVAIKNPASPNETDYIPSSHLEKAWKTTGTDDDIIFVVKHS